MTADRRHFLKTLGAAGLSAATLATLEKAMAKLAKTGDISTPQSG